jgi:RNA polymerase sigma factor (sigma-70 family)
MVVRRRPLSVNRNFVSTQQNSKFTEEQKMKNWHEYRNFRKSTNEDGSYSYFITADGTDVEVNEEIYTAYARGAYKMEQMERGIKCNRVKKDANGKAIKDKDGQSIMLPGFETSLDKLTDEDWEFLSSEPSPEDIFISAGDFEGKKLQHCLSFLSKSERTLIFALFYEGMTEEQYAEKIGITQSGVSRRKNRILKKLKCIFWKTS